MVRRTIIAEFRGYKSPVSASWTTVWRTVTVTRVPCFNLAKGVTSIPVIQIPVIAILSRALIVSISTAFAYLNSNLCFLKRESHVLIESYFKTPWLSWIERVPYKLWVKSFWAFSIRQKLKSRSRRSKIDNIWWSWVTYFDHTSWASKVWSAVL